jgi:hypothetical protein
MLRPAAGELSQLLSTENESSKVRRSTVIFASLVTSLLHFHAHGLSLSGADPVSHVNPIMKFQQKQQQNPPK